MPPTSRRTDRVQAAGSASRSRMYNLAGHAHSSGSLLPRSTDVHAASTSTVGAAAAATAASSRTVDAADAPYLTNIESHFGRVTLTAPDNLLRKQAKEKKQKIRQRKAETAHAAAAALAGTTQPSQLLGSGRSAMASSSNLLDSSRRYQTMLDDAPVSTGLLIPPSGQHAGMRRAHSGGQTPTPASTSQNPPPSTSQTVVARTRRRRPSSAARFDPSSRPASRASGPSRPESALSLNDADSSQPETTTSIPSHRPLADDPLPRSRTESAPAFQRRSRNAFDTSPDEQAATASDQTPVSASNPVPQTSLHRQNVWNDITEADPEDLPPPFPAGAPRPPTPPNPPTHNEAANDAQIIGPQPHARIPDSPPPPFVSDDEDESITSEARPHPQLDPTVHVVTSDSRLESRVSTPSSASASDDESIEITEERRAWEADIRNGLSFDVRLLREQQRRVARERAEAFRVAPREQATNVPSAPTENERPTTRAVPIITEGNGRSPPLMSAAIPDDPTPAVQPLPDSADHAEQVNETLNEQPAPVLSDNASSTHLGSHTHTAEAERPAEQSPMSVVPAVVQQMESAPLAHAVDPARDDIIPSQRETVQPVTFVTPADQATDSPLASMAQPFEAHAIGHKADTSGRLMLANEPRLGLPPMPASSRPTSSPIASNKRQDTSTRPTSLDSRRIPVGHRKTFSDDPPASVQGKNRVSSNDRVSLSGLAARRFVQGQAARGHDSESSLPLSRRPEDTLYVISAPPPATYAKVSSDDEVGMQQATVSAIRSATDQMDAEGDDTSSEHAHHDDHDEGAESDSSIEQWLAEAAAFDALRKREEETAARTQALQQTPASSSDEEDDAAMSGAFSHRALPLYRQTSITHKVPDPASLALMDQALPKAPPPLVLGRSRGGAAYSDSSSESTDTDDALDQYSSSDEDDEQHRAFYDARTARNAPSDPFVNSHKSMQARNTSSTPNLTIGRASEGEALQRAGAPTAQTPTLSQPRVRSNDAMLRAGEPQALPSQGPNRSLSLKAQGKLPERVAESTVPQQQDQRAGDFVEDTASSRDISDAEEPSMTLKPASAFAQPSTSSSSLQGRSESVLPDVADPAQADVRRSSIDPLLQPLAYGPIGRNDLKDRLKGLFGQPLVAGAADQSSSGLQASSRNVPTTTMQASPPLAEVRPPLSDSRRLSERSLQSTKVADDTQTGLNDAKAGSPTITYTAASTSDDASSTAPTRVSSLGRIQSVSGASGRSIVESFGSNKSAQATSSASVLPEQKARDEALLQIAQLSASTQSRQDSLAALERLLARTGRPTSMLPTGTMNRAELGDRLQLTPDVDTCKRSETGARDKDQSSAAATQPPTSNCLSRQGAIARGRGPLPSPPSALPRSSSSATRPVSFVNPRSSAAPLPRGRLPAITDATRHFPPSASSTGPGVAPSWLSYIPAEEQMRLPVPLEPQRNPAAKLPGGKVSAMISRFETASSRDRDQQDARPPSSPIKQSEPFVSAAHNGALVRIHSDRSHDSTRAEREDTLMGEERGEPAVFRRFSRNESSDAPGEGRATQRRPPPPPPPSTLPTRRSKVRASRHSEDGDHATSSASGTSQLACMKALAREIEQAASEWSATALHGDGEEQREKSESTVRSGLAVPAMESCSASSSAGVRPRSGLARSPRTQAMDALTGHMYETSSNTPPSVPPKSPLMTTEHILASASRNGLSASIAAAQAAAFARRDARESRTHSASWSMDTTTGLRRDDQVRAGEDQSRNDGRRSAQTSRALPVLPASLRMDRGLRISGGAGDGGADALDSSARVLPVPPRLPPRPSGRDWDSLTSAPQTMVRPRAIESAHATTSLPNVSSAEQNHAETWAATLEANSNGGTVGEVEVDDVASLTAGASDRQRESARDLVSASPTPQVSTDAIGVDTQTRSSTSPSLSNAPPALAAPAAPRRAASGGLTDFDLLVASLESQPSGSQYESLSAIGEFLGPAHPTASAAQLASLSVARVECDSRRITRDGKVKQKLSCVGVRVDKCSICLCQFREAQSAVWLPKCAHIFHEVCITVWLRRSTKCPTCRQDVV